MPPTRLWQTGPSELIAFALKRKHKGIGFNQLLVFLILDVGVCDALAGVLELVEVVLVKVVGNGGMNGQGS